MTQQEAYKIVCEMGAHPYSCQAMIDALIKGIEIGKAEQKKIDDDHLREVTKKLIERACKWFELRYDDNITTYLRKAMEEEYEEILCKNEGHTH